MLCRDLQDEKYQLILDSQDLSTVLDYCGIKSDSITGAIVWLGDGEYNEIWLTESARPYDLRANYHLPEYYKE